MSDIHCFSGLEIDVGVVCNFWLVSIILLLLFDVTQLLGWGKRIVLSFFVPALHGSCPSSLFLVLVIWVTGKNFCGPVYTLPPSQNVDIDKLAYPLHSQSKPTFCQSDTEGNLSQTACSSGCLFL